MDWHPFAGLVFQAEGRRRVNPLRPPTSLPVFRTDYPNEEEIDYRTVRWSDEILIPEGGIDSGSNTGTTWSNRLMEAPPLTLEHLDEMMRMCREAFDQRLIEDLALEMRNLPPIRPPDMTHPSMMQRFQMAATPAWQMPYQPLPYEPTLAVPALPERVVLKPIIHTDNLGPTERAQALLCSNLDDAQRTQFDVNGWFEVRVWNQRHRHHHLYRITSRPIYNVDRLHSRTKRPMFRFCCLMRGGQDYGECPMADEMLAQKLWLTTDEEGFLQMANLALHHDYMSAGLRRRHHFDAKPWNICARFGE